MLKWWYNCLNNPCVMIWENVLAEGKAGTGVVALAFRMWEENSAFKHRGVVWLLLNCTDALKKDRELLTSNK